MVKTGYSPSCWSRARLRMDAISQPIPTPHSTPSVICSRNDGTRLMIEAPGLVSTPMIPSVRKTAIGSLLPDSSSISGSRLPRRCDPRVRSTANTAAASVEETIEPSSRPVSGEKPSTSTANPPTRMALSTTPRLARTRPGTSTGRICLQSVSRPPENRMKTSATTPTAWAAHASLKAMPPSPSEPASMPMSRNSTSAGTPRRFEKRVEPMLRMSRTATMTRTSSIVNPIENPFSHAFLCGPAASPA